MVFRKFFGMIMSVSTLTIGRGAATPERVVNFSMETPRKAGINGLSRGPSSRRISPGSAEAPADVGSHRLAAAQVAQPLGRTDDGPDHPEHQDQPSDDEEGQDQGNRQHHETTPEGRNLE